MRQSVLFTTLLAVLLLSATAVSAQSLSVFGTVGFGNLSVEDTFEGDGEPDPFDVDTPDSETGLAIQAGVLYSLTNELGVGIMLDRVSVSERDEMPVDPDYAPNAMVEVEAIASLTGFDAVVRYDLLDSDIGFGLFGGVGLYVFEVDLKFSFDGDSESGKFKSNSALGFVVGGQGKYSLTSDLYATATVSYRSARFSEQTVTAMGITYTSEVDLAVNGLSFGAGIGYEF